MVPQGSESETSATYIDSLVRCLGRLGKLDAVLAGASPGLELMLRTPFERRWWTNREMLEFTAAVVRVGGEALVREIGRVGVEQSTSRVLRPFIAVLTAVGNTSPRAYFARWGQLTSTSVRHLTYTFTSRGRGAGSMEVHYPSPVPASFGAYWQGAFDVVFVQTRRQGQSALETLRDGRVFVFGVTWQR
jgi:hypothetical protein